MRVHSLSMSRNQYLALLPICCSISVSRSSKPASFPAFNRLRPVASSSRLMTGLVSSVGGWLLLGTILKQQPEALSNCPETSNLSQAFTTDEIINALSATKAGKAAGPDGIFPDMLKNIGPAAIRLLQAFYDDVVTTANIPKIWRSSNVIAIRKPGKPLDDPTSY